MVSFTKGYWLLLRDHFRRSKDGYVIKPTSHFEIVEDKAAEKYKLVVKKVGVDDAGVYTLTAKNEIGETAQQAKLVLHSKHKC